MNSFQKKICVICEGYEEYDYFEALKRCNIFDNNYIITTKNAQSIDKISSMYKYIFQTNSFDLVLVFCDTELPPYDKFTNMCKKIDQIHAKQASKYIVFFANPCTMQIILSHFGIVHLTTNSKTCNMPTIKNLTGVANYSAKKSQRQAITKKIDISNYATMKSNISCLSKAYNITPSTNFNDLLSKLEQGNTKWIDNIISKII